MQLSHTLYAALTSINIDAVRASEVATAVERIMAPSLSEQASASAIESAFVQLRLKLSNALNAVGIDTPRVNAVIDSLEVCLREKGQHYQS